MPFDVLGIVIGGVLLAVALVAIPTIKALNRHRAAQHGGRHHRPPAHAEVLRMVYAEIERGGSTGL